MTEKQKKYDVYGMGNALVDMVCKVDAAFLERMGIVKGRSSLIDGVRHDALMSALSAETREGGGSAANTMIALSHFGGRGFYSCKVADDEAGRFYLEELHRDGLDTNLKIDQLPAGVTGKCVVMVTPDADRTMDTFLGITETFSTNELVEPALAAAEYVYIEGYLIAARSGADAAVEARHLAQQHGVKIALTFSEAFVLENFRPRIDAIVSDGVDLIFCNEQEACAFAETDDLMAAAERMKKRAKTFAITRGTKGTLVYDGHKLVEVPTQKVQAIDTVGAGDMFAGAFLYGITHGFSYEDAGRLANAAASRVVTKYGPRLSKEELQEILTTMSFRPRER